METTTPEALSPVQRIKKDIISASKTLSEQEARYLVDAYYMMQEDRKRSYNQVRALGESEEPNSVISWLATQSQTLEYQIKRALDTYTWAHPIGSWLKSVHGIGPVIAAGLLAHINIEKAPTAGHIWSFAGLEPNQKWEKGQKRPFNAKLKVLCWKAGQSFMKFSNHDSCFYGKLYREKKDYYTKKNDEGHYKDQAEERKSKVSKSTEAYKHYSNGKLPPAQIDARARRFAVKIFLAHLQEVWYEKHYGKKPPLPYPIAHLGHVHKIEPPMPS